MPPGALTEMSQVLNDPLAQFFALLVLRSLAKFTLPGSTLTRFSLNLVLFAILTGLLIYNGMPPYMPLAVGTSVVDQFSDGMLKTIWWIGGAAVLVSAVRMFLILEEKPNEGRLLQDIVIAVIYTGAAFCVFAYVFRLPVGTVVATSGVFAIALGLALQSTLNDVFSGIALNLNRPLSVGDWVVLDENVQGKVLETNWRSTQFVNGTGDLVVVPNSILAKSRITNLSVPNASHGASFRVKLSPTILPSKVMEIFEKVLLSSNEILCAPAPSAAVTSLNRDAIEVEVSFRVPDIDSVARARTELFDLVYRHTAAVGLELATVLPQDEAARQADLAPPAPAVHLAKFMGLFPLFDALTANEKVDLATDMAHHVFKKDEVIAHKGAASTSLMLLKSGVAALVDTDGKKHVEYRRLAPGDLFGERGVLLGALESCEVRAVSSVVVCEITKTRLAAVLQERPAIAEQLALILSARTRAEEAIHAAGIHQTPHSIDTLRTRIRHLFHLK